jgi:hypothetical protein
MRIAKRVKPFKPRCIRCGALKSKRWIVAVAIDGTRESFCHDCHKAGYSGGFSYIGDKPYQDTNHKA